MAEISTHRAVLYTRMKNSATVFSAETAEMPTRRFAIVETPDKSADTSMPTRRDNPLREYVLRIMRDENLSYQAIETNAKRNNWHISRGTVQGITKAGPDATDNPGIFTLVALAYGLDRTVEEILTVTLGDQLKDGTALQKGELAAISELAKQLSPSGQKFYRRFLQMLERELRFMLRGE